MPDLPPISSRVTSACTARTSSRLPTSPIWSGFLYLSVVVDAWSRCVVGWSMKTHLKTELVLDALNMALQQRRPNGVIPS